MSSFEWRDSYSTRLQLSTTTRMSSHALEKFDQRTPDDSVEPSTAWARGEDIQHPSVVGVLSGEEPPHRVRVYHHNQEYFVIFLVVNDRVIPGGQCVVTVYNLQTHNHGPTQSYLASHGPHYLDVEDGGSDE